MPTVKGIDKLNKWRGLTLRDQLEMMDPLFNITVLGVTPAWDYKTNNVSETEWDDDETLFDGEALDIPWWIVDLNLFGTEGEPPMGVDSDSGVFWVRVRT